MTTAEIAKNLIQQVKEGNYGSGAIARVSIVIETKEGDSMTLMEWPSMAAVGEFNSANIIGIAHMYREWIKPEHELMIRAGYSLDNTYHKVGTIIVD